MAAPRKFAFDTVFDQAGDVAAADEDEVVAVGKPVGESPERLAHRPLHLVAIDRTADLAADRDAETDLVVGLARFLKSLLYEVAPTDPATLGGAALILLAFALVASWIPARRAARVDPMEALRAD